MTGATEQLALAAVQQSGRGAPRPGMTEKVTP